MLRRTALFLSPKCPSKSFPVFNVLERVCRLCREVAGVRLFLNNAG